MGITGVVRSINSTRLLRRRLMLAPHAFNTSSAEVLSSNASRRCSTVTNSCRLVRDSLNAAFNVYSSSLSNMTQPSSAHAASMLQTNGNSLLVAHSITAATLVAATSLLNNPQTALPYCCACCMISTAMRLSMLKNVSSIESTNSPGVNSSFSNITRYNFGSSTYNFTLKSPVFSLYNGLFFYS